MQAHLVSEKKFTRGKGVPLSYNLTGVLLSCWNLFQDKTGIDDDCILEKIPYCYQTIRGGITYVITLANVLFTDGRNLLIACVTGRVCTQEGGRAR